MKVRPPKSRRSAQIGNIAKPGADTARSEKPRFWAKHGLLALILLGGLIAYLPSFLGDYVYDDMHEIQTSGNMQTSTNLWDVMFEGNSLPARPIPYLTFKLNILAHGNDLFGFHVANLAIHFACASLLYWLLLALMPNGATWNNLAVAFSVCLLWVTHPLTTQAVTYIYQRIESLAVLLMLSTIYFLVRGVTRKNRFWLAISFVCCCLGMATKEHVIVLPLLAIWLDRVFLATSWKELASARWIYHVGLWASISILIAILFITAKDYTELVDDKNHTPLEHLLTEPRVLLWYVRLVFFPVGQLFEYYWPITTSPEYWVVPGLVILAGLGATLWAIYRIPKLGYLCAAVFVILAPTSSVVPAVQLAAEHRLYLPLMLILTLIVLGIDQLLSWLRVSASMRFRALSILALMLAVPLGSLTWSRNLLYQYPYGVWVDATKANPNQFRYHQQATLFLGNAGAHDESVSLAKRYFEHTGDEQGRLLVALRFEAAGRLEEAREWARAYVDANPEDPEGWAALGQVWMSASPEKGEEFLRKALEKGSTVASVYNNVARCVLESNPKEASELIERALEKEPRLPEAHFNKALIAFNRKDYQVAIQSLDKLVEIVPKHPEAKRLRTEIVRAKRGTNSRQ